MGNAEPSTAADTRLDQLVETLGTRLTREEPRLPARLVQERVQQECARFANARVLTFVPILVERAVRAGLPPRGRSGSLSAWAERTARDLLADELPRRWAHTQGVAHAAARIAHLVAPGESDILIAAAWLHDIGYASPVNVTGFHPLDGARYLQDRGVDSRVCALVAHHAGAAAVAELLGLAGELARFPDERGPVRDALWYCDMTTSPSGQPVAFPDRMAEIQARRGPEDPVVRALRVNLPERHAAVLRTERLLQRAAAPAA